MPGDEARVTVRVDRGLREAAMARAEQEDLTVSQAVRWFLRAWVQGDVSPIASQSEAGQEVRPET
jgi:antitoxin component of RelBE/YafQ-DinJ toxin-antitoxin module